MRKTHLVSDGQLSSDPMNSAYAGIVSHEKARIELIHVALMGIYICASDMMNAFVQIQKSTTSFVVQNLEIKIF